MTERVFEEKQNHRVVIYPVPPGGLPIVICLLPDRLHVYNDVAELKYHSFNQDLYSQAIGPYDAVMRKILPNHVLYGYIYEDKSVNLFHIWDFEDRNWLDINQIGKLRHGIYSDFPDYAIKLPIRWIEDRLLSIRAKDNQDIAIKVGALTNYGQQISAIVNVSNPNEFWMLEC
jgi:hypothetical protein